MKLNKESVLLLSEGDSDQLRQKRIQAWEFFCSTSPIPFIKYGLSIITPLDSIEFDNLDPEGNKISFSSPPGIKINNFINDERVFSTFPQERFSSLHIAFCNNFLHIKIPDNFQSGEPLYIQKKMGGKNFFEHIFIDVGKNCKLSILESLEGQGNSHSGGVEIFLGEGSSLLFGSKQDLSFETNNLSIKKAFLEKDSKLVWLTFDSGSRLTLSRIDAKMLGQGSSVYTKLMLFGSHNQHFDFNVSSIHSASDTFSDINQKAVLDGRAKMVINGLVKIEKNAPRSNGYQKEDTLLLSPDAEAAPIPALEIDNNNVRCTHGTTVGQIDKKILFYLMARGLDEETATRLVVKGFFETLISSLPLEKLQEDIRKIIESRLEEREKEEE